MSRRVTLKFKTGPLAGKSFSLGPGEYFFIGSAENCAIRIQDDPTIEPTHAAIYYEPTGKILFKDMGSKSGTFVNGKRITKSIQLKPGKRVSIGQFSTFQSSWWNALQATRLTRFSGLMRGNAQAPSEKKVPYGLISMVVIILSVVGTLSKLYWDKLEREDRVDQEVVFDDQDPQQNDNSKDLTSPKSKFSTPISRNDTSRKLSKSTNKRVSKPRIELTPERQFIWDEIVSISRRFGDPPPSAMDPGFVLEVERHLNRFTKNNHHQTLLNRKAEFQPLFDKVLREKGLPTELGYIVWVESNYKVDAKSPVGAAGLWQFMPETGAEYGLKNIKSRNDERHDPKKSTEAAADYFTSLLRMFGTERYLLAIASYNTGQNRVKRKQIASTVHKEHTSDFWQLRFSLPQETAEYVPKVIAAMIIGRNPQRYKPVSH